MKFNSETMSVLRSFADINHNIVMTPGVPIRTMRDDKSVLAEYDPGDILEGEMTIFDLTKFLNICKLLGDEPMISFSGSDDEKSVLLSGEEARVSYRLSPKTMLTYPKSSIKEFDVAVSFNMNSSVLDSIRSAASVLKVETLKIFNREGEIIAKVISKEDEKGGSRSGIADSYEISLGHTPTSNDFVYYLNIKSIPSFPGSYNVDMAESKIAKFKHDAIPLTYWLAIETSVED